MSSDHGERAGWISITIVGGWLTSSIVRCSEVQKSSSQTSSVIVWIPSEREHDHMSLLFAVNGTPPDGPLGSCQVPVQEFSMSPSKVLVHVNVNKSLSKSHESEALNKIGA